MTLGYTKIALAMATALALSACGAATPEAAFTSAPEAVQAPRTTCEWLDEKGREAAAVAANKIEVLFPAGSATLTPEANERLDVAARLFRDASPVVMFTTGYSDRSGAEYPNLMLSAGRAAAIKAALMRRGVPGDRLLMQAMGFSDPAVPSDPASARNRRVVITWRLV